MTLNCNLDHFGVLHMTEVLLRKGGWKKGCRGRMGVKRGVQGGACQALLGGEYYGVHGGAGKDGCYCWKVIR